jgi:MoxR-like ATPase
MDQNVATAIGAIPAAAEGLPRRRLDAALAQVNDVLVGKNPSVRMAFACLLAGGHLLVEDVPGVGKTTLAHALAATLGLSFRRIQFTSDLLPSDIVGVSVFDRDSGAFRFQPGPIFAQ